MIVDTIPALTIHRPWANWIADRLKPGENRTWHTTYRGPVWISAGKTFDKEAFAFAVRIGAIPAKASPSGPPDVSRSTDTDAYPVGVIALAQLSDLCGQATGGVKYCRCSPWFVPGQWHWHLTNVCKLATPVPVRGRQGLWVPTRVERDQLTAALAASQPVASPAGSR